MHNGCLELNANIAIVTCPQWLCSQTDVKKLLFTILLSLLAAIQHKTQNVAKADGNITGIQVWKWSSSYCNSAMTTTWMSCPSFSWRGISPGTADVNIIILEKPGDHQNLCDSSFMATHTVDILRYFITLKQSGGLTTFQHGNNAIFRAMLLASLKQ